jgi:hypothetical protein
VSIIYINPYQFAAAGVAYDTDAQAYITAVEAADGQALETGVRDAINAFVVNCKADGFWPAIKASCIMAGARTLAGALVPLAGAAPTRFGTEGGWNYNRKTGLLGNGTDNYLTTGLAYNSILTNNEHLSIYKSTAATGNFVGGGTLSSPAPAVSRLGYLNVLSRYNMQDDVAGSYGAVNQLGFVGAARSSNSSFVYREASTTSTVSKNSASRAITSAPYGVFCANYSDSGAIGISASRLAFYSIGESLDLALLDARVTDLINAFAAAIP